MLRMRFSRVVVAVAALSIPTGAWAQEDIEPRVVGTTGTMMAGTSGFIDRFSSTEDEFPWRVSLYFDLSRFVTSKIAIRGGLVGATTFHDEDDESSGPSAASLHAFTSALYFFTPQSLASLYAGGEYRAPLNRRAQRDAGALLGVGGVQAMFSSRAGLFIEGGYGVGLTKGDEGERLTRLTGQLGLRIRF
jgi:hypothetical protein